MLKLNHTHPDRLYISSFHQWFLVPSPKTILHHLIGCSFPLSSNSFLFQAPKLYSTFLIGCSFPLSTNGFLFQAPKLYSTILIGCSFPLSSNSFLFQAPKLYSTFLIGCSFPLSTNSFLFQAPKLYSTILIGCSFPLSTNGFSVQKCGIDIRTKNSAPPSRLAVGFHFTSTVLAIKLTQPGPDFIKPFSYTTQLSMKFQLLKKLIC